MSAIATAPVSVKNPPKFDKGPIPLNAGDMDYVAKQIAEGADKAGVSVVDFCDKPDLLATIGVDPKQVNPGIVAAAQFIVRKQMAAIRKAVESVNKKNGHDKAEPQPSARAGKKGDKSKAEPKAEGVPATKAANKSAKKKPTESGKGTRYDVLGFSATAVLRWMGKNGWNFKAARQCLNTLDNEQVSDTTIRIQLLAGKKGERGEPADVNGKQAKQLLAAAKLPKASKAKAE